LRNRGADCNVVSGCFITAKHFGVIDGVDYQVSELFMRRLNRQPIDHIMLFMSSSDLFVSVLLAHWVPNNIAN
jgi:hypothetical protein